MKVRRPPCARDVTHFYLDLILSQLKRSKSGVKGEKNVNASGVVSVVDVYKCPEQRGSFSACNGNSGDFE